MWVAGTDHGSEETELVGTVKVPRETCGCHHATHSSQSDGLVYRREQTENTAGAEVCNLAICRYNQANASWSYHLWVIGDVCVRTQPRGILSP